MAAQQHREHLLLYCLFECLGRRYARGNVLQCLCVIYARVECCTSGCSPGDCWTPFEVQTQPLQKTSSAISLPANCPSHLVEGCCESKLCQYKRRAAAHATSMRPTLATALIVSLQRLEAHLGSFDRTRTTRTMAEHVQRPEYSVAPPARLCLQDDAGTGHGRPLLRAAERVGCRQDGALPSPESSSYAIAATWSCTQGFLHKLFGAHDIRGRGSDVPGCAHADPFFLCDAVRLPRHAKPPFCAHPHSGAGVISLLFRAACTVRPWDNVQGAEAEPLRAGGIYHVDTGAGCVHDEPFDPLSSGETFGGRFDQQGPPVPADGDASWLAQLWYDALPEDENAPPRPVSSAVGRPEDVPVVRDRPFAVRVLVGDYGGVTGPVTAALPLSSSTGASTARRRWPRCLLGITGSSGCSTARSRPAARR